MHSTIYMLLDAPAETAGMPLEEVAAAVGRRAVCMLEEETEAVTVYRRDGKTFELDCWSRIARGGSGPFAEMIEGLRAELAARAATPVPEVHTGMSSAELRGAARLTGLREDAERAIAACGGDASLFDPFVHKHNADWEEGCAVLHHDAGAEWLVELDFHYA